VNALRKFLSAEDEPLRRYLYGVAIPVLALLVGVGVLTASVAALVAAVVGAVLLVPGVESLRAKVTPHRDEVDGTRLS
jgi:uncharacterized membrane protein HdeD (DUF308 family)